MANKKKCQDKTARGNVYKNEIDAYRRAKKASVNARKKITHYQCKVCGLFHIGSNEGIEDLQENLKIKIILRNMVKKDLRNEQKN